MTAPVNAKVEYPTITLPNWDKEAQEWVQLNSEIGGNQDFFPLTIKAAYVIGIIHDICTSVSILLNADIPKETTYLPAYSIFASGIDLLGRCINGNESDKNVTKDIKTGFKWLKASQIGRISDSDIIISTPTREYSVNDLVYLRHFCAHGQAISNFNLSNIDFGLMSTILPELSDGLERYWGEIVNNSDTCNNLAKANILALRNHPIKQSWVIFEKDDQGKYSSIIEIFNRFNWTI